MYSMGFLPSWATFCLTGWVRVVLGSLRSFQLLKATLLLLMIKTWQVKHFAASRECNNTKLSPSTKSQSSPLGSSSVLLDLSLSLGTLPTDSCPGTILSIHRQQHSILAPTRLGLETPPWFEFPVQTAIMEFTCLVVDYLFYLKCDPVSPVSVK